jgi:hypothetical protein
MKRQWRTRRQVTPYPDGQRRWDRAYQLLLEWTTAREPAQAIAATANPCAVPLISTALAVAPDLSSEEVEHDASCPVCARLGPSDRPNSKTWSSRWSGCAPM